ncbi:tetraspanin-1 [Cheilinus undulatus]|uniref:tetraspanin-1 n=1 Tax=Cheilinus undulatus TaxID=241271 RepID=UPI001BD3F786|nr:tetraspanin-1 [Cheilinus undulatus]
MGCFTFVKLLMVLFNLLIFLGGLTLLSMGIWVSVDGGSFLRLLGPFSGQGMQFVNVGFFCIAIGAVLVLLGLLGCCGAHKESKCLLLTFFSIILIIFIAEVAAGVVALAYSSFAEGILRAWATPALQSDYGSEPVVTKMWNTTMTEPSAGGPPTSSVKNQTTRGASNIPAPQPQQNQTPETTSPGTVLIKVLKQSSKHDHQPPLAFSFRSSNKAPNMTTSHPKGIHEDSARPSMMKNSSE